VVDKRVDLAYDAASFMTGMTRYQDLGGSNQVAKSDYTYDPVGRLTNLKHSHNGNTIADYGWTYDGANRITKSVDVDGSSDYSYDKTNQLTGSDRSTQSDEAYSYDSNGNRIGNGYSTGANNQLLSDGTYNYEYDGEGNRTKRTEIATGVVDEYVWDYRNRLTSVVTKGSNGSVIKKADYTYDAFDKRIEKKVDADGDGAGSAEEERFVYAILIENQLSKFETSAISFVVVGDRPPTDSLFNSKQISNFLNNFRKPSNNCQCFLRITSSFQL
jgi:YD repeat-containing protein